MDLQKGLNILSGIISCGTASWFAWQIMRDKLQVNLATWGMILILDAVGLVLTVLSGNHEPYLQAGWMIAAILIMIAAVLNRGDWEWTGTETICLVCCAAAGGWWVLSGSPWALAGYVVACYISVVPQAKQYVHDLVLARTTAWIWVVSAGASAIAIMGQPEFTPQYLLVPIGMCLLNLGMSWLTLRKT